MRARKEKPRRQREELAAFRPTLVLDATFDAAERREFAKHFAKGLALEDERLKGGGVAGGCRGVAA